MTRTVHDALATQYDQYEVRRELHRERPHSTYEVTVDGRRAVCKVAIADEMADVGAEAAVDDHLDRTTAVPVPSILAAGEDFFVAAWADSLPDPAEAPHPDDLPAAHARALGATMARIHEATADQFARPGFPRFAADGGPSADRERGRYLTVDDRADWLTVVREWLHHHRSYHAEFGWAGPADEVTALLDDRPGLFDGAGTPVLCHGNVYPEHVGFAGGDRTDPGAVAAVVDFEHALVAPAEYDFWRTGLPVFHTMERGPRPQFAAYREGYESVRPLPAGVERRRDAWWLVNTVTYFSSLIVEHGGIGPDQREQAAAMGDWVDETVASIRDRER